MSSTLVQGMVEGMSQIPPVTETNSTTTFKNSERTQDFAADPVYGRAKSLPMLGAFKT